MNDQTPMRNGSNPADDLSAVALNLHESLFCWGPQVRVEILAHLACGEMNVGDLTTALRLEHTLVSKYLHALRDGGIIQMRKEKTLPRPPLTDRAEASIVR